MYPDPKPYQKSLEDELDWKLLDQLYGVVLQISSFCYETKKFCVTTQFVVMTILIKLTGDKLDHSIFVAGCLVPMFFWFLDSVAYYYQVKLRGTMELIREKIKDRYKEHFIIDSGVRTITKQRVEGSTLKMLQRASINHSMWIYGFMVITNIVVWCLFSAEVFK